MMTKVEILYLTFCVGDGSKNINTGMGIFANGQDGNWDISDLQQSAWFKSWCQLLNPASCKREPEMQAGDKDSSVCVLSMWETWVELLALRFSQAFEKLTAR